MNEFVEGYQSNDKGNNKDKDEEQDVVLIDIDQGGSQDGQERQQDSQQVGSRVSPKTLPDRFRSLVITPAGRMEAFISYIG
jgi:hypothetical protein